MSRARIVSARAPAPSVSDAGGTFSACAGEASVEDGALVGRAADLAGDGAVEAGPGAHALREEGPAGVAELSRAADDLVELEECSVERIEGALVVDDDVPVESADDELAGVQEHLLGLAGLEGQDGEQRRSREQAG